MERQCGYFLQRRGPFFAFLNEDSTVKLFIDAVSGESPEEALAFISKSYVKHIDLLEIKNVLNHGLEYKYLVKAEIDKKNLNLKTNSVLIINKDTRNSVMHMHLVREPDVFGNWKIYGIERE